MKHYTVKSKLPSNTIIPIIENNTSSYMLSKVVSDNLMLCKIESNNCFDLFYTGKKLRGHSLYWIQVKIINDNNSCILQLQKKLRTDGCIQNIVTIKKKAGLIYVFKEYRGSGL